MLQRLVLLGNGGAHSDSGLLRAGHSHQLWRAVWLSPKSGESAEAQRRTKCEHKLAFVLVMFATAHHTCGTRIYEILHLQ